MEDDKPFGGGGGLYLVYNLKDFLKKAASSPGFQ